MIRKNNSPIVHWLRLGLPILGRFAYRPEARGVQRRHIDLAGPGGVFLTALEATSCRPAPLT
jgi:hypothetical protein